MATASTVPDRMSEEPSSARLLFCPFCRECYEDRTTCPEHELDLVEFQALPRQAHERELGWEDEVLPWDLRFGRLELMAGIASALAGFFALPLVVGSFDDQPIAWTAMETAMQRAPNLWSVPFVAVLFVVFLHRRRTPLAMRGARLAGIALGLMSAISLGYSLWQVQRGVIATHGALAAEPGAGAWVIGAASVLFVVGAARFGAMRTSSALPHGAAGELSEEEPAERAPRKKKRRRR